MPIYTRHTPFSTSLYHAGSKGSKGFSRLHAMAAAALVCTGMLHLTSAQAMALGPIHVQSLLGEPLRAEIEVFEMTKEDSENLKAGLGSVETFKTAGMEFNAALSDVKVALQRRANGRAFLQLSGSRTVNEPFIDLVLEANWKAGRMVRNYTLLFDPPNLRPQTPAPIAPIVVASNPSVRKPDTQKQNTNLNAPAENAANQRLRVKPGDTAGRIAAENLPANISLDQMLVALLRANPKAFIKGNINYVKAGAVLTLPSETTLNAVTPGDARQIISAQGRDFNELRRRLANQAPKAPVAAVDREAKGQIQAEVKEQTPVPVAQDKLTVSKGATTQQGAVEAKIAQERQTQEAAARATELTRNIKELSQVSKTTVAGTPPSPTVASAMPAPALSTTIPVATSATESSAPVAVETSTAITAPALNTTPAEQSPPASAPTTTPEQDSSLINQLLNNPLVMPVAAGLLALLAGLGIYSLARRKRASGVDSSFLESPLQADSVFANGSIRGEASDASVLGSSMAYSSSQLDVRSDADPVAEADVYLAYGRDLQAEEILKEAMRSTPTRVAIHNKLLEIYAKRRDIKAFEVVAIEAYGLTHGEGHEWAKTCQLGIELDPLNPLYQPGGKPAVKSRSAIAGTANAAIFGSDTLAVQTQLSNPQTMPPDFDLDLDLDFDLMSTSDKIGSDNAPRVDGAKLNSGSAVTSGSNLTPTATARGADPAGFVLDFPSDAPAPTITKAAANKPAPNHMAFDLNDIELNLNSEQPVSNRAIDLANDNPLETKLSLAEEFRAIGDLKGARSLAEEVLSEATGALKTKVTAFLADLT